MIKHLLQNAQILLHMIENNSWEKVRDFLNEITLSFTNLTGYGEIEQILVEVVRIALFCIDEIPRNVFQLLLTKIDHRNFAPSLREGYDSSKIYSITLFHDLLIDHKFYSLIILLKELGHDYCQKELSRVDYIFLELDDYVVNEQKNDSREESNFFTRDFHLLLNPLQAVWEVTLFRLTESDVLHNYDQGKSNDLFDYIDEKLWKMSCLLIHSVTHDFDDDIEWNYVLSHFRTGPFEGQMPLNRENVSLQPITLLHSIAMMSHSLHAALMYFASRQYPHMTTIADENGNLPLHVAVCKPSYFISQRCVLQLKESETHLQFKDLEISNDIFRKNVFHVWDIPPVQSLLKINSASASIFNKHGQLPLHLFLCNFDNIYHSVYKLKEKVGRMSEFFNAVLLEPYKITMLLVSAYPESLECLDPLTGLYPFAQASSVKYLDLNIVYELIRMNPAIFKRFCM